MGDLNVRREEVAPLCEEHGLRAMALGAATWNARVNKFYEDQQNRRDTQEFDQILSSGSVWVEGHVVCACREYVAGRRFFLSDHFALLGLLDVHASFGSAGGGIKVYMAYVKDALRVTCNSISLHALRQNRFRSGI